MSNNMSNFLSLVISAVPNWVADSFPTIRIVLLVLCVCACLALVLFVMISPAGKDSGNVITGEQSNSDTYYSKNKSKMSDGFKKRVSVILSISIAVLIVLFYITVMIYMG